MAEEAFEPDTASNPADPLAVIADLTAKLESAERANTGVYRDLKEERSRRKAAERERYAAIGAADRALQLLDELREQQAASRSVPDRDESARSGLDLAAGRKEPEPAPEPWPLPASRLAAAGAVVQTLDAG